MSSENPILNSPYDEPKLHYATDPDGSLNYNDIRDIKNQLIEKIINLQVDFMKIVPIFAPYLHSFKFGNSPDELNRLFDMWTDTVQLYDYFKINSDVLKYEKIGIDEAITQTIEYANLLYDLLSENRANLDDLFQVLSNYSSCIKFLPKYKSKKRWLRLYAIKIDSNYYVITGGAIKQSQEMRGHPLTREELKKLEQCRNFLIDYDVFDSDSLMDFVEFEF